MTESKKKNIIKNYITDIEINNNPYYDVKVRIVNIEYVRQTKKSAIEISYWLTTTSKLDSKYSLEKHKTSKLLGTFESIFIQKIREEKLNRLGI